MAENAQDEFNVILNKLLQESPPEIAAPPPQEQQEIGLASLISGAKEKAGDLWERYKKFSYPPLPDAEPERKVPKEVVGEPLQTVPSIMDIIYQKETGIYDDPFIRTASEGEKNMDAFGPGQLRSGILEDLSRSKLSDAEEELRNKLIKQSEMFEKFNRGEIKDPDFGPKGKGFGFSDNERILYKTLAEKALLMKAAQRGLDINNLSKEDVKNLIGDWFSRKHKDREDYIESAIDQADMKSLIGAGIIEPLPLPLEKPVIKQRPRSKGGMVQRNPYPYNPRAI
jgi:hypothetical protein